MTGPASALIYEGEVAGGRPWPRRVLTISAWDAMRHALGLEPGLVFQGLWADTGQIHALFRGLDPPMEPLIASVPVERGLYGALSPWRPGAALFERMITDLWGHRAADTTDPRPWLDHGTWPVLRPMSTRPVPNAAQPEPWEPLPSMGKGLHQIPLGPVQEGVAEPRQLRVTAAGEQVVRLEARLGYAHRGALLLMRSKPVRTAASFAARLSGDSTVAHATAFARAVEAASRAEVPPRAAALRGVTAEVERVAAHLADLSAIFASAGLGTVGRSLSGLREQVLRASGAAFGHRLMMDLIVPGGVAADLTPDGEAALHAAVERSASKLNELARLAGLSERMAGVGHLPREIVAAFAPGGIVGRAAGRAFDLRQSLPYPPYDGLPFTVPLLHEGDVAARVRLRVAEIGESLRLLSALLGALPDGPLTGALPGGSGEGLGWAESARGDVWHWVRLDGGMVATAFARDPAWLQWPMLEAATAGCAVEDIPLIEASIGARCAGVDL